MFVSIWIFVRIVDTIKKRQVCDTCLFDYNLSSTTQNYQTTFSDILIYKSSSNFKSADVIEDARKLVFNEFAYLAI